jgi:hypothetical protein
LRKPENLEKKTVPKGTLDKIVSDVEIEAGLSKNSNSLETVRSRIKRGKPDAIKTYLIFPIADLELLIVEFCIRLAKIGDPLTKRPVIQLTNSLKLTMTIIVRSIIAKKIEISCVMDSLVMHGIEGL